jgi:hypothetical protein
MTAIDPRFPAAHFQDGRDLLPDSVHLAAPDGDVPSALTDSTPVGEGKRHSPGRVYYSPDWRELRLDVNDCVIARLPAPHASLRGKERAEELAIIRANGERLAALWNAGIGGITHPPIQLQGEASLSTTEESQ